VRALKEKLGNIPNPITVGVLNGLGEIPRTVELKCPHKGCKGTLEYDAPRWTIHLVPTVVLRQFTCPGCRHNGDWKPLNTTIKYPRLYSYLAVLILTYELVSLWRKS
jgi:hypothetical protein